MIYLISHMSVWLLLVALFAALAGWAYAARRAAPAEASARRERNKLMRDLINIGVEIGAPANGVSEELERQMDILRRRAELDASRVAELERSLETARASAMEAQGHAAELQRALDRADQSAPPQQLLADISLSHPAPLEVEATPVADDDAALQTWRLRYFEQRVRYLENARSAPVTAPVAEAVAAPAPTEAQAPLEWRARMAEAQVAHLEQALRDAHVSPEAVAAEAEDANNASPFAADSHVDVLLRWRLLYLERRVAFLQQDAAQPAEPIVAPAPQDDATPDPDRWKWRARYLEARVRHLEGRLDEAAGPVQQPVAQAPAETAPQPVMRAVEPAEPAAPAPLVPRGSERRPPSLPAARNGAPDDLTLIDGVSMLQQTTLNSLGIYHFDQIAAWAPANIAWVDQYLRLRGRIVEEEWVEQADDLAREGPEAARQHEDETV